MSAQQSYYIGIKGIVRDKSDKVLILKDSSTGRWEVPGGRMDAGQTIEGAFAREIGEEVENAVLVHFGDLLFAAQGDFLVENEHKLLLLFYIVEVTLPPNLVLSSEHTDSAWVDTRSLENYTIYSSDKAAIQKALNTDLA
ncbi:MAG TPA: NUDIX hydrolase [Patescibacteria group bacterium]|nr:NUDIX hydrolase [Patescibacteria group bacterium]